MENNESMPAPLNFEKYPDGMMPVAVQDVRTGNILMQAFTTRETLDATLETGKATFMSRSRGFWCKGDTSGDWLKIVEVRSDCDPDGGDSLIYLVEPQGEGACHNAGWGTCFRRTVDPDTREPGEGLNEILEWQQPFWAQQSPTESIAANRESGKLYFGIPSGSLNGPVMRLLRAADMIPGEDFGRRYEVEYNGIVWRVRDRIEMATKVVNGVVDAGITGKDYIAETGQTDAVQVVADYIFSRATNQPSKLVLAAREGVFSSLEEAKSSRIATEFPRLTRKKLLELGWKPGDIDILLSLGKTEAKISDGEARLCTDITETGNTLRANGMAILATLFESNPQLIANFEAVQDEAMRRDIEEVATALNAALDNENNPQSWIEMNVPSDKVDGVCRFLAEQGYTRKSPTVLQTADDGWAVIRTLVKKTDAKQLQRQLERKFNVEDVGISDVNYFVSKEDKVTIS